MTTDVVVENDFLKKLKKPGLWDRGVATGGLGQKSDRKKWPSLSDSGMVYGGLTMLSVLHLHLLVLVPYFATRNAPFAQIREFSRVPLGDLWNVIHTYRM